MEIRHTCRRLQTRSKRKQTGQAVTAFMIFLAAFVVLPLSVLAYDISLFHLAKQQLKSCVESCSLAAAATNASSDSTDVLTTQKSAIATAMKIFQQNSILDQTLTAAQESNTKAMTPAANQALLYFEFLDPITRQVVPLGNTNGKILRITGAFGFVPQCGKVVGMTGPYTVTDVADSGLPMLDIVLCLDISASMDDFTPVTVVNRYKNGSYNGYQVMAQGPLYNAFSCTSATGTGVNATFPQSLDASSGSQGTWSFSTAMRGTNNNAAATKATSTTSFTDVVVNIDGTNDFSTGTSVSSGGSSYYFPANNIGCLVEASRGNLESVTIANNAKVPYSTWGVTPKSGYYQAYVQAAFQQRHPIAEAIAASQKFFSIMNNNTDAHFGLVTFSSVAGTSSTSTVPADYSTGLGNITDNASKYSSNAYPTDPYKPMPPNPEISLKPTPGPAYSNYSDVTNATQTLVSYGGTDIAGALQAAVKQLKPTDKGGEGLSRKGSTKAIVLFTDGLPTASSLGGDPTSDSRSQAYAANQAGIPVYCIGLCLVPTLQSSQTAILTDQNSSPTSGGIAGISGNGAAFYQATNSSQLNAVFENVARALVQLVR